MRWSQSLLGDLETTEVAPGAAELKLCDNIWIQLDDTGYLEVGGGSAILRFETDDIEADNLTVKALSDEVEEIEEAGGVVRYFDFKDPYGNRLSYYQWKK